MRNQHLIPLFGVTAAIALTLAPHVSRADVPVSRIAESHGLRLAWLDPQVAVGLSGPGVRIVLRPGDQIVEINGKLVTLAAAPYVRRGQMFVTDATAERLGIIARAPVDAVSGPLAQAPDATKGPGGAITLFVNPVVGAEALAISGTAPPGRVVQILLQSTFSRDLPDVVLSRQTVLPDGRGNFAAIVPIASGFFRGSIITVVASTPPSGPWTSARYMVSAPNVTVPPDNLPHSIQR
jgi:Copper amine oxidase N-terminal domain